MFVNYSRFYVKLRHLGNKGLFVQISIYRKKLLPSELITDEEAALLDLHCLGMGGGRDPNCSLHFSRTVEMSTSFP